MGEARNLVPLVDDTLEMASRASMAQKLRVVRHNLRPFAVRDVIEVVTLGIFQLWIILVYVRAVGGRLPAIERRSRNAFELAAGNQRRAALIVTSCFKSYPIPCPARLK